VAEDNNLAPLTAHLNKNSALSCEYVDIVQFNNDALHLFMLYLNCLKESHTNFSNKEDNIKKSGHYQPLIWLQKLHHNLNVPFSL